MSHTTLGIVTVTLVTLALVACQVDSEPSSAAPSVTAPAPQPAAPSAPAAPAAPAPAAGGAALTASKIAVPLGELTRESLESALTTGGWKIGGSTATRSSMLAINMTATKGDATARINFYNPASDFWVRRLQKINAAIHRVGEAVLGVAIEGNQAGAQALLDSLVGAGS